MVERIALLGTGVIGGSIALRLAAKGVAVVAFDSDPVTADKLVRHAGIEFVDDPAGACRGADLAVVAVPVDHIVELCRSLAGDDELVVTDVGSAKSGIVRGATEALGPRFVGGHPMAGSEKHGFDAADPTLFEDAPWILTPTGSTDGSAYGRVTTFVTLLGAKPVALDPAEHDRLVARLSHLPQLTASVVVQVAVSAGDEDALLGLAAGGFRDVTRIAASHPEVWVPILRANREGILEALDGFESSFGAVREMVASGEWDRLEEFLSRARHARLGMFTRPDHSDDPVSLTLLIPDRPGVLAEVTTAAGQLGANIEDLKIFHSSEGGKGRLELVVSGGGPADSLSDRLVALGYHVERGLPQ